jgi:hypothetical protein
LSQLFQSKTSYFERPGTHQAKRITRKDEQQEHLFTPQEASKLISDIKPLLKELVERKRVIGELDREMQRYSLLGFKTQASIEKAANMEELVDQFTKKIAELEDLGVEVKDLDYGLVDFPAERYGEKVLLCWRYGEPEVAFWHEVKKGYRERKSLKAPVVQP